jgi:hypothetical protein
MGVLRFVGSGARSILPDHARVRYGGIKPEAPDNGQSESARPTAWTIA